MERIFYGLVDLMDRFIGWYAYYLHTTWKLVKFVLGAEWKPCTLMHVRQHPSRRCMLKICSCGRLWYRRRGFSSIQAMQLIDEMIEKLKKEE